MIVITPKILVTLYKGHLPIGYGHLDPEGGRTWLAVSVATGHQGAGNGSKIVKALCKYADKGGWELWLTCHQSWSQAWYGKFGFKKVRTGTKTVFMKRKRVGRVANDLL